MAFKEAFHEFSMVLKTLVVLVSQLTHVYYAAASSRLSLSSLAFPCVCKLSYARFNSAFFMAFASRHHGCNFPTKTVLEAGCA